VEGDLIVEDGCIYLKAGEARYLIASMIPGARWNAESGTLDVPPVSGTETASYRTGERVMLGGSESTVATLEAQWVDPPATGCDTGRIWVTHTISAAS
jgi:hypothetical protein